VGWIEKYRPYGIAGVLAGRRLGCLDIVILCNWWLGHAFLQSPLYQWIGRKPSEDVSRNRFQIGLNRLLLPLGMKDIPGLDKESMTGN